MSKTETDQQPAPNIQSYPTLRLVYSASHGVIAKAIEGDVTVWVLSKGRTYVGRSESDTHSIVLSDDRRASERHAILAVSADRCSVTLRDADSKNGTFVNGERVRECQLQDGDVLRIGNSLLLLRFESTDNHPVSEFTHVGDGISDVLVGDAPLLRHERAELAAAAPTRAAVLLIGESGVGKDVAAGALHSASGRLGRFVPVNCAAIPATLAESLLFGHTEGAFTGASKTSRPGLFQEAHGGTLFLDEVGDLPTELQPKLLRAIETGMVTRVGSTKPESCDVRIVAATNRNLPREIADGRFRGDLYARLAAVVIELPALRLRREDILPLFLRFASSLGQIAAPILTPRLAEALLLYEWPYNVREVVQLTELVKIRGRGKRELDLPLVAERLRSAASTPAPAATTLAPAAQRRSSHPPLSREVLARLMTEHNGVISQIAEAAGRSRKHIRRLLVDFGLRPRPETK